MPNAQLTMRKKKRSTRGRIQERLWVKFKSWGVIVKSCTFGIKNNQNNRDKITLKIIIRRPYKEVLSNSEKALKECLELLAIFSKSIETAKKNLEHGKYPVGI